MAVAIKTVNIQSRKDFNNGYVVYTVLSSNGVDTYHTTLVNGHATGCTCPATKPCYHMTQLEQNEKERATDLKQHLQDAPHSCIYCGHPMKHDGVCARCA